MDHSPLPWKLSSSWPTQICHKSANGLDSFIASTEEPEGGLASEHPRRVDNAAFIVHAANNHDALAEALEELLAWVDGGQGDDEFYVPNEDMDNYRAALAQTKGEPS